jgi:hypothetical protein
VYFISLSARQPIDFEDADVIVAGPDVSRVKVKREYSTRLRSEWRDLYKENPALYSIVTHLAGYCGLTLKKNLVITQIFRTKEQQKAIYGPNTKKKSPHMFYCAVDLRCRDSHFTKEERGFLEGALRKYDQLNRFKHMPSGSGTVWIHSVGDGGIHFHIQFYGVNRQLPSYFQLPTPHPTNVA